MSDNGSRFTRLTKIFLILALAAFLLGNAIAIFICYAFMTETPSYTSENIMNPIASMALLGTMLTFVVGCTMAAGIGNVISIFFSSFSISFSPTFPIHSLLPFPALTLFSLVAPPSPSQHPTESAP